MSKKNYTYRNCTFKNSICIIGKKVTITHCSMHGGAQLKAEQPDAVEMLKELVNMPSIKRPLRIEGHKEELGKYNIEIRETK